MKLGNIMNKPLEGFQIKRCFWLSVGSSQNGPKHFSLVLEKDGKECRSGIFATDDQSMLIGILRVTPQGAIFGCTIQSDLLLVSAANNRAWVVGGPYGNEDNLGMYFCTGDELFALARQSKISIDPIVPLGSY